MEFRDNLLQNEVNHLGNNFRLLSTELLLIQDFIKAEFGAKFLAFCNVRREQQRPSATATFTQSQSPMTVKVAKRNRSPRKSKLISAGSHYGNTKDEADCQEFFEMEEEPCIMPIPDPDEPESESEVGSDHDYDPIGMADAESEMEEEVESKHNSKDTGAGSGTEAGKKGRQKSIIHKYYDQVQAEDGKLKTVCQTCGNFVSSQAQRLKKHMLKCGGSDSRVMQILDKLQVQKYKPPSNSAKGGRKTDIVRLAFVPAKDHNGFNKSKCLNCGDFVSSQPLRMRKHLNRCTGDGDFEDNLDTFTRKVHAAAEGTLEDQPEDISSNSDNSQETTQQLTGKSRPSSSSSLLALPPSP